MTHNNILMNDEERLEFKGKYRGLVLLLDLLILTAAIAIAVGIIAPATWTPKIPVIVGCGAIAVISLVFFIRNYRRTKAWLSIHGTTKAERMAAAQAKADEERARIRAELEAEVRAEIAAEQQAGNPESSASENKKEA